MDLMDIAEDLAKELADNHRSINNLGWRTEPEDSENWCIIWLKNRDSKLIAESNYSAIERELKDFDENSVRFERHSHWGYGWVETLVLRVYDEAGEITEAFKKYTELHLALKEHLVLDETDYCQRKYELEESEILSRGYGLFGADVEEPENWALKVHSYISRNNPGLLDEECASLEEGHIKEALNALNIGYVKCPECEKTVCILCEKEINGEDTLLGSCRHKFFEDEVY